MATSDATAAAEISGDTGPPRSGSPPVDALFFDVFGTLVDWRGTIAREAPALVGRELAGFASAGAWRAEYRPGMEAVRSGARGYVKLDLLHCENLDRILPGFGLDDLGEDVRAELDRLWRRLDVARPDEHGPGAGEAGPSVPVDVAAGSLSELAERLGA